MKLDVHIEVRSYAGLPRGGDAGVVRSFPDGTVLLALIDATGHGLTAYRVAQDVREVLLTSSLTDVGALLEHLHQLLRGTVGAAVSLAQLKPEGHLIFVGVGNVQARLDARQLLPRNGALGQRMRKPEPKTFEFGRGQQLMMYTDGVSTPATVPTGQNAEATATRLIERYGKAHDDSAVLIARWIDG